MLSLLLLVDAGREEFSLLSFFILILLFMTSEFIFSLMFIFFSLSFSLSGVCVCASFDFFSLCPLNSDTLLLLEFLWSIVSFTCLSKKFILIDLFPIIYFILFLPLESNLEDMFNAGVFIILLISLNKLL